MLCKIARSKIFQYVDGELPDDLRGEMEEHLASCSDCRHMVNQERLFRDTYLLPLRPDPAPERVRERVGKLLSDLVREERSGWGSRLLRRRGLLAAVAAVMILGGVLGVNLTRLSPRSDSSLIQLADASVELHQKLARGVLPLDIERGSLAAAEQWFKGKVDFNFSLPELRQENLTFLGGRVSHLRDFEVAALEYRVEEKNVSLFILPPEKYRQMGLSEKPKFKMVNRQGYDVIVWSSRGTAYSLVSEIGEKSCLVCHSSEEKLNLTPTSQDHPS